VGLCWRQAGISAELRLIQRDGAVEMLPSRAPHMQIGAGDRFVCVSPAGAVTATRWRAICCAYATTWRRAYLQRNGKGGVCVVLNGTGSVDEPATIELHHQMRMAAI